MWISIHAPTRGATVLSKETHQLIGFQSTLPQGERLVYLYKHHIQVIISIHAPTRGATADIHSKNQTHIFQSTLPQGERHSWLCKHMLPNDFNPRSHKGSDLNKITIMFLRRDFNPRSHKGSDFNINLYFLFPFYFNPRSHKGSDFHDSIHLEIRSISIHAPTRGATTYW